ncbi:MAG: hypothetical protein CMO30_22930 [Tistrella sp.]|uniref:Bacterial transcription activator effector binding domain-containing protein n=1 Tax=Tistrella mobilis TaxID=171437 RepID=A0A3B9IMG1_9PROT|nr:GyrI-like domain-containing protein [Tistrella sp.]MAD35832.1 hypothetical protein [Tistrella sp.]MBA78134.1 hypothetical protein [Tistrella sp.]HAE49052.1 hypothetical protein [Tistrella mobilis]
MTDIATPPPGFSRCRSGGFAVTGLAAIVSNDDPDAIGALWGRWFAERPLEGQPCADAATYAVYDRYQGDHSAPFRLTIGRVLVPGLPVPDGLIRVDLATADFLVLRTAGRQPAALAAGWARIWQTLPDRAFRADFDRWPDAEPDRADIHVELRA